VDQTTDTVRSSQQVRRSVEELLQRHQDEFDNGYNINNVSLTNISIRVDRFHTWMIDLNDLVSPTCFYRRSVRRGIAFGHVCLCVCLSCSGSNFGTV